MDNDLLKLIASYTGLIAVVVSIIALASQVRRHTQSLRSQTYAKALDRLSAVQSKLGTDATASRLFSLGVRDPHTLTPGERIQLAWMLYEIFGGFEFMFEESRRGTLPPEVWSRWSATAAWWISLPGVVDWWHSKPTPFTRGFSAFIESLIARPGHDKAAAERWEAFLRQGRDQ